MCFIPRSMFAIKFHSGTKHVEVLAACLPLRHQKVTISITSMPPKANNKEEESNLDHR